MSQAEQILAARFSDSQEVLRLSQGAVHAALLDHKRSGDPIAVWRDGQVIWLPPDQIELPEPPGDADVIDLQEHGIDLAQVAELRARLAPFAADWDAPEMDVYDNYSADRG